MSRWPRNNMQGKEAISGDIVQETDKSVLFAIEGDADNKIWIPKSVIVEGDTDVDDGVDLLVETWWYVKNEERFN